MPSRASRMRVFFAAAVWVSRCTSCVPGPRLSDLPNEPLPTTAHALPYALGVESRGHPLLASLRDLPTAVECAHRARRGRTAVD
jgi:hypothetical protein